jgi:hypothetical protein
LAVQDAIVLGVGDWREEEVEAEPPPVSETGDGEGQTGDEEGVDPESAEMAEGTPQPVKAARLYTSITLGVTPQDALIIKYLSEVDASIDLAVRAAADVGDVFTTSAVTLDYVFERYSIDVPPKLPYGLSNPSFNVDPVGETLPRRVLEGVDELGVEATEIAPDKSIEHYEDVVKEDQQQR